MFNLFWKHKRRTPRNKAAVELKREKEKSSAVQFSLLLLLFYSGKSEYVYACSRRQSKFGCCYSSFIRVSQNIYMHVYLLLFMYVYTYTYVCKITLEQLNRISALFEILGVTCRQGSSWNWIHVHTYIYKYKRIYTCVYKYTLISLSKLNAYSNSKFWEWTVKKDPFRFRGAKRAHAPSSQGVCV